LPNYSTFPGGQQFPAFRAVSVGEVLTYIGRFPDKTSAADPVATSVLKDIADFVAPYESEPFLRSLSAGYYPLDFKTRLITPMAKKTGMDASDVGSYRHIANLRFLSKLFERVVAAQILDSLSTFNLLPGT
jgi:hypothetical protein